MNAPLQIRPERADQPEVLDLLAALDSYLASLYAPEDNHILGIEQLLADDVLFLVARQGGAAVGCGAVRCMPGEAATAGRPYGEIKRMFVAPAHRGRRVAEALLTELEAGLCARGIGQALLETGRDQAQALALYRRCGYATCPPFGGYPDNGLSVFLAKTLQLPATTMQLSDDDFTLFGLPQQQALDAGALAVQWRALQARVHPDRFASEGPAAQRLAMQWAVRVNEAYQRLKDPLRRAAYLCELRGAPIQAENNTAMPGAFLMQQMAWREALDEADGADAVQALDDSVAAEEGRLLQALADTLDVQHDAPAAAQQVRALMFVGRFREDIARRLAVLDA